MGKLAHQEVNGIIGERRTENLLLHEFWVLKRSGDIAGTDFLVEPRVDTLPELDHPSRYTLVYGRVQSKYFESLSRPTGVKIDKEYVETAKVPRNDFFAILHTDDQTGQEVHYFFTASEIVRTFNETKCGRYYYFRLTKTRDYLEFKNQSKTRITRTIREQLLNAKKWRRSSFVDNFVSSFYDPAAFRNDDSDHTYHFRIVENCPVVLVRDESTKEVRQLDPRRDRFEYSGEFAWGCAGTGPQFLTVSILSNHLQYFTNEQFKNVLNNLVANLSPNGEYDITSAQLNRILSQSRKYSSPLADKRYEKDFPDYGDLDPDAHADKMVGLLGPDVIACLDDPNTTHIGVEKLGEPVCKLDRQGEKTFLNSKLSTESIRYFLTAAARYSRIDFDYAHPLLWTELPPSRFKGAWVNASGPPCSENETFLIITREGLSNL